MVQRTKKRRRKRHYKTGEYSSQKLLNGPAHYRSGWELKYFEWLDKNDDVVSYLYEGIVIGYLGNKSGKIRHYYPDLLIEYKDGTKHLVEIKPSTKVEQRTNKKKFLAALVWCSEHDAKFEVVTEKTMSQLGILL